ncbi:cbb3-type cytochrome oxidase assembly protein CcoS [Dyella halodurans]|uniref:Cbb3-type cytochrome oxidase assembly protein CcoS n=1 Tax=Dyella halodurans TaxID=1920171 RepID=A0ABV9C3M0_9GAMM|nr:cbb3-type cytochrome oxidase assembly protein CcoS [Dyella halodurans]
MNILLVLIPVTLLIVIVAVAIFFWAVNHQQFDDLESPGMLPLMEEADPVERPAADSETPIDGEEPGR